MRHVRRLHLLRHAKSSWADDALDDHDRPLADRGRLACALLTAHLLTEAFEPGLVLASTACRVVETVEGIGGALPHGTPVRFDHRLYTEDAGDLRAAIAEVPDDVASLLVVAHNPAIEDLARDLAGDDLGEAASRLREKYPTGALATFDVVGPWTSLAGARLRTFVRPRDLSTDPEP
jgi:phosphohistidine phosphatase